MCTPLSRYSRLLALIFSLLLSGLSFGDNLEDWERSGTAANIDQELYLAARDGDAATVQELLAAGAKVNHVHRKQSPRTALGAAIAARRLEVVKVLADAGAEIADNVRHDATPLTAAAAAGDAGIVAFLLERGVDPDQGSLTDGFPLLSAALHGHLEVARMLLNAGADVNQKMRFDGTPLIAAVRGGNVELVELLLASGAAVNQGVKGDDTPLIAAVRTQQKEVVEMLLEAGADVSLAGDFDARSLRVRTPLNQAERGDSREIVALLKQYRTD